MPVTASQKWFTSHFGTDCEQVVRLLLELLGQNFRPMPRRAEVVSGSLLQLALLSGRASTDHPVPAHRRSSADRWKLDLEGLAKVLQIL